MSKKYAIGVDLGGTKIATGLADVDGQIIAREIIPTMPELGVEAVMQRINSTIHAVIQRSGVQRDAIVGIGICCPGPLNPETGVIAMAPNLNWRNVPVVSYIVKEFGIPTFLENDANAAALAEKWFGAGRDAKNLLYITVSTGVGGGLIFNNDIFRGRDHMAGEIGHTIMIANGGPLCGCGQHGCLEAISSGTAIAREARRILENGVQSKMREMVDCIDEVDAKVVADAAAAGDPAAQEILDNAFYYLGIFIVGMLNILNIDKVVIGGGVSKLGSAIFDPIRRTIKERMADVPAKETPVVPAETGENVGILGSVGLVLRSATGEDHTISAIV